MAESKFVLLFTADSTQAQKGIRDINTALGQTSQAAGAAAAGATQVTTALAQADGAAGSGLAQVNTALTQAATASGAASAGATRVGEAVAQVGPTSAGVNQVNQALGETAQQAGAAAVASTRLTDSLQRMTQVRKLDAARDILDIRSFRDIQREIDQVNAAYNRLSNSGKLSAQELAVAAQAQQAAVARLKAEMAGVKVPPALDELPRKAGISAGQTAAAFRSLPAQLTDTVTQLQGGASPLTVLLQQGGQVKDQFGGLRPTFAALTGAITPTGLALGSAAVALTAVAAGALAGYQESNALNASLARTGNVAGVTLGQIDQLSRSLASTSTAGSVTIGTAREITAALVDTGQFGGAALNSTAAAAAALSRVTGQSAAQVVASFDGLGESASAWATKANKAYNFLTAAQVAQIRALESEGRNDEAVRIAMDALAGTMEQRLAPNLGTLERGWQAVKGAVSDAWDAMKDIGRDDTAEQKIQALESRLAGFRGMQQRAQQPGGGLIDQLVARVAGSSADSAQAELDNARGTKNSDDVRRAERSAAAKAEQLKIEEGSRAHVDALLSLESAGAAKRLAQLQAGADQREQAAAAAYRTGTTGAAQYAAELLAIQAAGNAAQLAELDRKITAEQRRVVSNPQERLAREAAVANLEAQRTQARTQATVQARELRRSLEGSQGALDLAQMQGQSDEALRLLDAAQTGLDEQRKLGLVSEAEAAQGSLTIERARLAEQARMVDAQIALEKRRQASGTAALDSAAKVKVLENQRAGLQGKIDAIPVRSGALDAAQQVADARTAAAAYAQVWADADRTIRQQGDSVARGRAALLGDAEALLRQQIDAIERDLEPLRHALELRISLTTDESQKAALQEHLDKLNQQAGQSATLLRDQKAVADGREAAAAWAQTWTEADRSLRQQAESNAQARATLLTDPLEQAREQTRLQVERIQRDVEPLRRALELRISLTSDAGQQAVLQEQLDRLGTQTADAIALANDGLAERMKPGWQKLVDGWSDTTRLMRESSDELMTSLVKGGEDAFAELASTGRVNIKGLLNDLNGQAGRLVYRSLVGALVGPSSAAPGAVAGAGGAPGGGGLAGLLGQAGSLLRPAPAGSGNTAREGDPGFMGPLQELGDAASTASTTLRGASDASALLDAGASLAGGGLGKLGNGLVSAVQAVLSFVASLQASSAGSGAGGLLGLLGLGGKGSTNAPTQAGTPVIEPNLAALGATFTGSVAAFAAGGSFTNQVVSQPTNFRFSDRGRERLGLMGEAGPEAVMPLDQAPGGGLGVAALDGRGQRVGTLRLARDGAGSLAVVVGSDARRPGGSGDGRATAFATGGVFAGSVARFAAGAAFSGQGARLADAAAAAQAGSAAAAGAPALQLTLAPVINIDARTDQAQVRQLVMQGMSQAVQQAQAAVLDTMRRNRQAFAG